MKTRIYKVMTPIGAQLIRAATPAAAIRHAVRDLFSADVATHDDLEKAVLNGEKIFHAGEDTSVDAKTVDAFPDPAVEALQA